jgi:hypothetical protein
VRRNPSITMTEPRTRTLSFRLTERERQRIDTLARAAGLETSEFARRALLDVVAVSERDREQLRKQGRAEVRVELAGTQAALIRAQQAAAAWRSRAESLEAELKAAPEQLVGAIRRLIDGEPGSWAAVARLWAPVERLYEREELLPQLAAEVGDGIEAMVRRFPTSREAVSGWPDCRRRIEWLMDALRPDVGSTVRRTHWDFENIWKHVVGALDAADEQRRRSRTELSGA